AATGRRWSCQPSSPGCVRCSGTSASTRRWVRECTPTRYTPCRSRPSRPPSGQPNQSDAMDKLLIRGGRPLRGEIRISGAKNAALPELCAALLSAEPVTLKNIPRLQDVATMLKLIRNMGATAEFSPDGTVVIASKDLHFPEAPYEMVKTR